MATYNDFGIVLNSFDYGESDKILHIYTKNNGLVKAICKGSKKTTSKFKGKIDKLSCLSFQFARGKSLDIISECVQINSFSKLRTDLLKLSFGILFLEIVNSFAHEQDLESVENYNLLYEGLDDLQNEINVPHYAINFLMKFLKIHGYKPQFNDCVMCNSRFQHMTESTEYPYSSVLGGLLCMDCSRLIEHKKISSRILEIIRGKSISEKPLSEDIKHALRFLKEHISARSHNEIKSFDLVFSL